MVESKQRQLRLKIDLGGEQVDIVRIRGTEEIARPFHLTVEIVAPLGEVDMLPHLSKAVVVSCYEDEKFLRHFHGLMVDARMTKETEAGHNYALTLVPWTALLDQNVDYAIYQDKSAVEIIRETFERAGISDFDLDGLTKTYDKRVYCVQYAESDFAFATRLMEEEGIYYYFDHREDRHIMKLCDSQSTHPTADPEYLEYNPTSESIVLVTSDMRASEGIGYHMVTNWHEHVTSNLRSKVTVRDYDFEKADRPVEALSSSDADHPNDDREVYVYPGNLVEEARARHLGEVQLESHRKARQVFSGESQSTTLTVGSHVEVGNHPHARMNTKYLLTKTYHSLVAETYRSSLTEKDEDLFHVRFEAIPASRPYRPDRTVPRPIVRGLESAVVTGPEAEEIFTDEWGRVKVRFHWDRSGSPGETSTCWIRVSQTGGLGNLILPRVSHEVLVDFINGDPDRPIVVGRVFNSQHKPIYPLPEHKTRALWRTKRYGNTGQYPETRELDTGKPGVNELRFEDKGGSEEVFIHAERDMNTRIRFNETLHVGHDQEIMVGHDRKLEVGNDETIDIQNDQQRKVANDQTLEVGRDQKEDIGSTREVGVGRSDTLEVGQDLTIKAGTTIKMEAGTSIEFKVGMTTIKIDNMGIQFKGPKLTLKADAMLSASSMMTEVKGSAMLTESGGIVMIN
ncbi:hypothetical protein B2G71_03140 [Novosphingobium sp. PC22D]|uniref:type VI secretion system Vgr family protein n=1 Tax=Novosphingobium sp. PC22D TaxID=1962403 RepID=UPI000BF23811|nr:type VI secretion system tip protein TssI/VgrG [Novosphingobium sp. PC22D]PEQ14580.1 hypothetical protein B2G71_03140 [Novosphingobium sp. PC22D]